MSKKINSIFETTTLDGQTGELIRTETEKSFTLDSEPSYVKLYLQDVLYFKDMQQGLWPFLNSLVKRVTYASDVWGNCVLLNASIRKVIQEECGYKTIQSVYNNTKILAKGGIIEEVARDIYRLNPFFFGKGDRKDIEKIRAEVSYSAVQGKTFSFNFNYNTSLEEQKKQQGQQLKEILENQQSE